MEHVIGNIYYALGIFVIIKMVYSIFEGGSLSETEEWKMRFSATVGRKPKESEFRSKKEFETMNAHYAIGIVEIAWCLIGFFFSGRSEEFSVAIASIFASWIICKALSHNSLSGAIRLAIDVSKTILYLSIIIHHAYA